MRHNNLDMLQAKMDRIHTDLRAARKHGMADLEKQVAHLEAAWKGLDKRWVAAGASIAIAVAAAGTAWALLRRSPDEITVGLDR